MMRTLPSKSLSERLLGLAFVVLLHLVLVWALFNGLVRKVVEQVVKEPLEVVLIEEPKPVVLASPLPEPTLPVPPPPKPQPPRPPRFKPARLAQPAAAPIAATAPAVKPIPPTAPRSVALPAASTTVAIGMACPNYLSVRSSVPYPGSAERRGLAGQVVVEFTVNAGGTIENVRIASSSNAIFNDVVLQAVRRFQCVGQGAEVRVLAPFEFTLK